MYDRTAWEKNTIIKDSVHGYINIPKPIVREIIDTDLFQRLKNIEQTGMQVLYPSATHNRFMHSLGVYHLSKNAFHNFMGNVKADYNDIFCAVDPELESSYPKTTWQNRIGGCEAVWKRWEIMFQLASLLHDCGHTPFSHTLEFIYDLVEGEEALDKKLLERCSESFKEDFEKQGKQNGKGGAHVGKPHERMSALLLASDEETGSESGRLKGGFRQRIRILIQSYLTNYGYFCPYTDHENEIFKDDIEFMIRMIIGCKYEYQEGKYQKYEAFSSYKCENSSKKPAAERKWLITLQLRNCIIGMLNSKLDVDNLDYVVRDSKYSGYASNNIDLERLLASFTIVRAYEFDKEPFHLSKDTFFDGSVNLKEFTGSYIKARVSGRCAVNCKQNNIKAEGNVRVEGGTLPSGTERKIFKATEDFSAMLMADTGTITIKPPTGEETAYINIVGALEGDFRGTFLGETYEDPLLREKGKIRICFAYKQNCMSVLMSAIEGSNFENKWVYAHHTTTFKNNYLTVYLLERYTQYLVNQENDEFRVRARRLVDGTLEGGTGDGTVVPAGNVADYRKHIEEQIKFTVFPREYDDAVNAVKQAMEEFDWGERATETIWHLVNISYCCMKGFSREIHERTAEKDLIQLCLEKAAQCMREKCFFSEKFREDMEWLKERYALIVNQEMQFFSDIISPLKPKSIQGYSFFRTVDADLVTAYKQLYLKLQQADSDTQNKYQEFMISYRQMASRDCMKCLWKTYPEYNFYFGDWTDRELKKLKRLFYRAQTPWGEENGEKQKNYSILSDYVTLTEDQKKLWEELKREFNLSRLVYVEQEIRTKSFLKNQTYMKNHKRVVRLEDIRLYPNTGKNVDFFFMYYDQKPGAEEINVWDFLKKLRNRINMEKEVEDEKNSEECVERRGEDGTLVIRDNVHGDIKFSDKFAGLVDAREFQRLRRVRQLATASLVFPGAVHTRFAHSIGTYYVMQRILQHFDEHFARLDEPEYLDETEKNAILAAALLHDLGHGPFSHAFEGANLVTDIRSHSEWTKCIIRDTKSEIHKRLLEFGPDFPEKVISYIECEEKINKGTQGSLDTINDKLNLKFIFASLVSGQIDADRMDYLLRDSVNVGIVYGQFDLAKVIEGLTIFVEHTGKFKVCIREENFGAVQGYFFARFQMYANVYHNAYKTFTEKLFCRILKKAEDEYISGALSSKLIPPALEEIFCRSDTSVDTYCQLDDNVVMGAIQTWSRETEKLAELSLLCRSLLNRKGFRALKLVEVDQFCNKVEEILKEKWDAQNFLIKVDAGFEEYDKDKPIYILKNGGYIESLQDVPGYANHRTDFCAVYYNAELFEKIYDKDSYEAKAFKELLDKAEQRKDVEIERKYVFEKERFDEIKQRVLEVLKETGYQCCEEEPKQQQDVYYDTDADILQDSGYSLRIRQKGTRIFLTCKSPIQSASSGLGGQLERREREKEVDSSEISDNRILLLDFFRDLKGADEFIDKLIRIVEISNLRTRVMVERNSVSGQGLEEKYELVFDQVVYQDPRTKKMAEECQIEIELKSAYDNRLKMKLLTDKLESAIDGLTPIGESKFVRAVKMTQCV